MSCPRPPQPARGSDRQATEARCWRRDPKGAATGGALPAWNTSAFVRCNNGAGDNAAARDCRAARRGHVGGA
ncbi:hypothetical protein CKO45_11455 [Paracraurococcus ruber]|uniref:Uncharacterized protein n=1 Tax=Paracraurococcus ruber TaxID=77675 RepID=A0ABS1CWY6_9PROT|nr:hypothetical protein [Paracraurococcus ruber]